MITYEEASLIVDCYKTEHAFIKEHYQMWFVDSEMKDNSIQLANRFRKCKSIVETKIEKV